MAEQMVPPEDGIRSSPDLTCAFPVSVRDDVRRVLAAWAEPSFSAVGRYQVRLNDELLVIPDRVYFDPNALDRERLSTRQLLISDCLLTRHSNGYVREAFLRKIIGSEESWIPTFVIRLIGEYVVEILKVIDEQASRLRGPAYVEFVRANAGFVALTEQRMISYWDCYHRTKYRSDYVGFRLIELLRSFGRDPEHTEPDR